MIENGFTAIRPAYAVPESGGYSPDEDWGRFTLMLKCGVRTCGEIVSAVGTYQAEEVHKPNGTFAERRLRPTYMSPGPSLCEMPDNTPKPVREALLQSFSLFWADLGATANKLRVAAERVLNDQGVKQYNRTGKRVALPLAKRIELYSQTKPGHKEVLDALCWVGNHGSHSGEVARDDVLTAFELMQSALQDLYGNHYKKDLARRGRDLVARRGKPNAPKHKCDSVYRFSHRRTIPANDTGKNSVFGFDLIALGRPLARKQTFLDGLD